MSRTSRPRHEIPLVLSAAGLALLLAAIPAEAGDNFVPIYNPELRASRVAGSIRIDGELDDPGWVDAGRADNFAEHRPGDQVQPPVDTEAYITYDDEYLYVAFLCYDDPAVVRASFCERDHIWSDDYVILLLDTYASQTWAYEIACNPYGVQGDLLWSTNGGEDVGYDLVYEAAGKINGVGYQVEMAIPFASLRFPGADEQNWRVDFWRNHPREVRGQYSWAAYDRDDPCWACQWGTVHGIRDVQPGRGIELLPSLVSTQAGYREDAGGWQNDRVDNQLSLGGRYALSSNVNAEGSYNPDFSQVESDAAQIDVNTTFALYYPEKRPFFQEGSDMFNTYFTTVYTRSINDPRFAVKLTGRPGKTNVAFLSAQDEHTPMIVPFAESSEFAAAGRSFSNVLRAQQMLGEQSHLGLVATDRRLEGGGSGSVMGVDGRIRLDQNYHVQWQALATHTEEPNSPILSEDFGVTTFDDGRHTAAFDGEDFWGYAYYLGFGRSARHFGFQTNYYERSPTFRADNGFEPQNDSRQVFLLADYTFYPEVGLFEYIDPYVQASRKWNFDGTIKDEWVQLNLSVQLKWAQTQVHTQYLHSNELFHDVQFDRIYGWHVCTNSVWSEWLRTSAYLNAGHRIARSDLVMGQQLDGGVWFELKPLDRLVLETDFDWIRSDAVETGERLFEGFVTRGRMTFQLTRELSTRLVAQYNHFAEQWEMDPLISYRLNPFSIFYVGSTRDYRDLTPEENGSRGWQLTDRQYFMKLQYLFQL